MKRHASPIASPIASRPLSERVRLVRDFVLGALFLGGLLAFIFYVLIFWQPKP